MRYLKNFESVSNDEYYKEIDVDEYNSINNTFNRLEMVRFSESEASKLKELFGNNALVNYDLLQISKQFKGKKDTPIFFIKKGYDDWFLVHMYYPSKKVKWKFTGQFWVCDQFDGLLKFLSDFND
jgi:hypothetical protein